MSLQPAPDTLANPIQVGNSMLKREKGEECLDSLIRTERIFRAKRVLESVPNLIRNALFQAGQSHIVWHGVSLPNTVVNNKLVELLTKPSPFPQLSSVQSTFGTGTSSRAMRNAFNFPATLPPNNLRSQ